MDPTPPPECTSAKKREARSTLFHERDAGSQPSAAGKTKPHAAVSAEGEEADVAAASIFNASADHAAKVDPAHQQSKDCRKQNMPPWIEPLHLHL